MISREWAWIGACSIGSSHAKSGKPCQDYAACIELPLNGKSVLVAAVSDGAGSKEFSEYGSRIVVHHFIRAVANYLQKAKSTSELSGEVARDWIDDIRDRIAATASAVGVNPKEFSATLVAAVVCPDKVVTFHIGDGACVVRNVDDTGWQVPSWPAHGEYASSTYFVTDDPEPHLRCCVMEGDFGQIALFSDGLERLALDFPNKSAFGKFLDPMFTPLSGMKPGRARHLSTQLRTYLDSKTITDRTDDDKSFVLARRVPGI